MKGIGVGQRPGGVAGIIINLHDQNSAVCSKFGKRRRKEKKRVRQEVGFLFRTVAKTQTMLS